ncbi:formate dehydrogenase accessory sulfurtransferase FdhD [Microvirga flavescens]|uniref:formate dehydrogenase accessory sulfurtransferase FdhD n=1 Tax=Microvirga flavescens TaxID=2249811 RepID=UPI001FE03297|nr:formate dehydrogenase accessory sulfurtransferase FdhD [Microvirga flavescens]
MPLRAAKDVPTIVVPFGDGDASPASRAVPVETPVNLIYAGLPFAVMMATPSDLEDFAYGFSLTEGIIEQAADIRAVRVAEVEKGLHLDIDLVSERLQMHLSRRRALAGRTGCGLCGIDDLEALPKARAPSHAAPAIAAAAIARALDALERAQPLNRETRAVHAAAWADLEGNLLAVREDVGRHNALDKLIGALLRDGTSPAQGFVIVTSRCSFELVEKVAAFGARTLVAISAPTSLALDRARDHDMTLIGIARRDTMTVFHGRERIRTESAAKV